MNFSDFTKIPRVLGLGIATSDGFIIESEFTVGYEPEKFGAMASRIINQTKKSLGFDKGCVILYTTNIVCLVRPKGDSIIFVIANKEANLGLIKLRLDKI